MAINLVEESVKEAIKQSIERQQKKDKLLNTRYGLSVYGYIRENFDEKCLVHGIIATIIQFYMAKGGKLYVFGCAESGQLGIEKYKNIKCQAPTLCPLFADNNAYQVSVANGRTLILDTDGDVWSCGSGMFGQLGHGNKNNLNIPTKLNLAKRIISISAGKIHCLLLCDDGEVKGFGLNTYGQAGHGPLHKTPVRKPQTIDALKKYKVVQICAGALHSAALTEDGVLFCFGINSNSQCGVGEEKGNYIMTPTRVQFDEKIAFVECGSKHTLIISCNGLIYSFGNGYFGQLGHASYINKWTPTLIEALKEKRIKTCAAGENHSLCINEKGTI